MFKNFVTFFLVVLPTVESRVLKSPAATVPGVEPLPFEQGRVGLIEAHCFWPRVLEVEHLPHPWCWGGRREPWTSVLHLLEVERQHSWGRGDEKC